jgi:hypothetical protein
MFNIKIIFFNNKINSKIHWNGSTKNHLNLKMLIKIKFDCLLIYKKKLQLYLYNKNLVYCSLYKIMKKYFWKNYNKIEGFFIH